MGGKASCRAIAVLVAFGMCAAALAALGTSAPDAEGAAVGKAAFTPHDPIIIGSDSEFNFTNGVSGGAGTHDDPYIIDGWSINKTNYHGIKISSTTAHYKISNCQITGGKAETTMGIELEYSGNGTIENCYIEDTYFAINLYYCYDMEIEGTMMDGNFAGVAFDHSPESSINGSAVLNCENVGIVVLQAHRNAITGTTFENNTNYAIRLMQSQYNRIYGNIFNSNNNGSVQAYDDNGTSFWNTSEKGNRWSDWLGPDAPPADGIVDAPYEINGFAGAKDYFPISNAVVPEVGFATATVACAATGLAIFAALRRRLD